MADDVTENSPTGLDPNDPNNPNNPNSIFNPNNPNNPNNPVNLQVSQGVPNVPLQNTGTDDNLALGMPTNALSFQQQTQADINLKETQDELFSAISRGDRVRVEELIANTADVLKPDSNGQTAIADAVENNDMGISRDFLQQKTNGNIAFDPTADANLTGGLALDNPLNPLNPLNTLGAGVTAADAQALGLTAAEAEAMGNYALAAQLEADENYAQEALEENEGEGSDAGWDGDMSYEASVSDDDDDNQFGDNDPYDPWGDDDDMYADNDPYDDYADPYGADDDPSGGLYDNPNPTLASNTPDPTTTTPDPNNPNGTTSNSPGFFSSFLGAAADVATLAADATLINAGTNPNLYSGLSTGMGSLMTDMAALDLSSPSSLTSPTNGSTSPSGSSMFFNFASPTTSGGNSIWNTSFFDPQNVVASLSGSTSQLAAAPSIAPTNPYYKPSSPASSMSMGA